MAISNDAILNVSLTLFSQNGYDGTSLQDIADRLKVTKGALFKHYDGKEALWNALIDKVEAYYGEHFGKVKNIPLPDTLEELRKLTLRQVDFTLHDETVKKVRKLLVLEQFRDERTSALATKHFSGDIEAIYTDIFEHLMKNGKVKAGNASLLALGYTAPITMLIHLCDREPQKEKEIMEKINAHIERFLSVYGNNNPTDDKYIAKKDEKKDGEFTMNVTYEQKEAMTFIGFYTEIKPDEGYRKCPEFWDKEYAEKYARLWKTMKPETAVEAAILENSVGMYAICADGESSFTYWIAGLYKGGNVPEGLELYTFPAGKWAMFAAKGALPNALQSLNTEVWQKWLPTEGKKRGADGKATVEVYSAGNPQSPDYECGIWMPIKD